MEIVKYPHPALRRVAKPIREVTDEIRSIAANMIELMHEANGVGLAANQVGLPIQMFVVNFRSESEAEDGEKQDQVLAFINPRITQRKGIEEGEEGCLSFPGLYANVKRAERVTVTAQDLDGKPFEMELEAMAARITQHEFDHLQGVLFIDKTNPLNKIKIVSAIKEFERVYREAQQSGNVRSNIELEKEMSKTQEIYC